MDIKCDPQPKDAVKGNSSELIWWLSPVKKDTLLGIEKFDDNIILKGLPKNIDAEVESVVARGGEEVKRGWPQDGDDAGLYKPNPSDALPEVNTIVIRLTVTVPENGLQHTVMLSATIGGEAAKFDEQDSVALEIHLPPNTPEIRAFRAVPSLIGLNTPFRLEWLGRNAVSWELDNSKLKDTLEVTGRDMAGVWQTFKFKPPKIKAAGPYTYRLVASSAGGAKAEASARLRVVETQQWRESFRPWDDTGDIRGLCVGVDYDTKAEKLYAVVLSRPLPPDDDDDGPASTPGKDVKQPGTTRPVGKLWSSEDGLSWTSLGLEIPQQFVTSPVIALPSTDAKNPKPTLVFAGGSKIDYDTLKKENFSDEVYLLNLNSSAPGEANRPHKCGWPRRAGHVCLLGKDEDGEEKVWIIGGLSPSGAALRDAWVCKNPGPGRTWNSRQFPDWKRSYHFTAAVKQRGNLRKMRASAGPEFWFLGGFQDRYDGTPYGRVHIFQTEGGIKSLQQDDVISDSLRTSSGVALRTSGVALVALHELVWLICTQAALDVRSGNTYFQPLEEWTNDTKIDRMEEDDQWLKPDLGDHVKYKRIEAVAFNGCIWVFALYLKDDLHSEIKSTRLQYYIPKE